MKVKSLEMKHFKKFRQKGLDFSDPETGLARDLIVLVGNNGAGKSTVLQALVATLGPAVKRLSTPADLDWPGFSLALAGNSWNLPLEVTVDVEFSKTETEKTREYFELAPGLSEQEDVVPPSADRVVRLTLSRGKVRAARASQMFQFRGRQYAKQIIKLANRGYDVFRDVGTVFWYTEDRTAVSLTASDDGEPIDYDETLLRRRLADLMQFHQRVERKGYDLRPGQRDLFRDLEQAYRTVFPERRFEGSVPRSEIDEVLEEPWFFLYDGAHQYEIAEMSGGERSIFPLLFDFANWNIHNSVIVIDEIELHLHPPMQQALIRAIQNLGQNNQFIISTHSEAVEHAVPPESIVCVEG